MKISSPDTTQVPFPATESRTVRKDVKTHTEKGTGGTGSERGDEEKQTRCPPSPLLDVCLLRLTDETRFLLPE